MNIRRRFLTTVATAFVVGSLLSGVPQAQAASGYNALAGSRLYDSRSFTAFNSGETRTLTVAGSGGVPAGATGVVLNVTAVSPSVGGYFTVWPTGQSQPGTSNVNFRAGDTVPNAVVVQLGAGGAINLFNFGGTAHMLVDVAGYFEGGFTGVTPTRLLDTRSAPATANDQVVQVAGRAGIPTSGVAGVMLNVTVVTPAQSGYTTVHPDGTPQPNASNLNFVANEVVANAVGVGLGSNGSVRISHESPGVAHYLVDVVGYFPSGSYVSTSPTRVFDTRKGAGGKGLIRDGESFVVAVTGVAGLPTTGVGAVLANVTVTGPSRSGYATVWPNGVGKPNTSVVNFSANQTKPNLAVLTLGDAGAVNVFVSSGSTHVLIDVLGYFPGVTSGAGAAAPPIPVPTIGNANLNEWNTFRTNGRTCANGTYAPTTRLKLDDTLQSIAQANSNAAAAAGANLPIADATVMMSEYRGLIPPDFDWFVLSGPASEGVTSALAYLATVTTSSYCPSIFGANIDAGVGVAVSSTGRKYFTFLMNTPSYASTFTPANVPGAIRLDRQQLPPVDMP
jgi:hypothetical protein